MKYDAIIIGSGPNGLSAAITIAQNNLKVLVVEARETIGGGLRSAELTLPGYIHDICSAIHPMAVASPFLNSLPLEEYGLEWINPEICVAHPLENDDSVYLYRSMEETISNLGIDGKEYQNIFSAFNENFEGLLIDILGPLKIPNNIISLSKFGLYAVLPAKFFAEYKFKNNRTRTLFLGLSGHSVLPLTKILTSAIGLVLGISAHNKGWPIPKGGSQMIASAMASYLISLGGEIKTNFFIKNLNELPLAKVYLFDTNPNQLANIAGKKLSTSYIKKLQKYRYGPGVFKVDWALNSPIPWKSKECLKAGTIHIASSYEEIINSEQMVWENKHPEKPFIIMAQQSLFDTSRSPNGKHTAWGYCHVPNGSIIDMTEKIENQIEKFAPGFKDCILSRHTLNTKAYNQYNPNMVGGDIIGGVQDLRQLYTRPVLRISPYSTPAENIYICSASTPPGGGVHGMCGYHAAKAALKKFFNIEKGLKNVETGFN